MDCCRGRRDIIYLLGWRPAAASACAAGNNILADIYRASLDIYPEHISRLKVREIIKVLCSYIFLHMEFCFTFSRYLYGDCTMDVVI